MGTPDDGESLAVLTNDPDNGKVALRSRAKLLTALRIPSERLKIGPLARTAGPTTGSMRIERGDDGPLNPRITALQPPEAAGLEAVLKEIEPGEIYDLEVTISPPWPVEGYSGRVVLATGIEQQPEQTIGIRADFEPRLRAEPASIMVAPDTRQSKHTIKLLWSTDNPPGRILEATTDVPGGSFTLNPEEEPPTLSVVLPGLALSESTLNYRVLVETDDPAMPRLRIPIQVRVNKPDASPQEGTDRLRSDLPP